MTGMITSEPNPRATLDYWLEEIAVHHPADLRAAWADSKPARGAPCPHPEGWWGVSHPDGGIVAYFATEGEACWYRLALVNRILNPLRVPVSVEFG